MTWPIHDYDPRPDNRRLKRAVLVLAEKLARELYEIVDWLNRRFTR